VQFLPLCSTPVGRASAPQITLLPATSIQALHAFALGGSVQQGQLFLSCCHQAELGKAAAKADVWCSLRTYVSCPCSGSAPAAGLGQPGISCCRKQQQNLASKVLSTGCSKTVLELSQPRRSQLDCSHACGTGLPAQTNKSNLWSSFWTSLSSVLGARILSSVQGRLLYFSALLTTT